MLRRSPVLLLQRTMASLAAVAVVLRKGGGFEEVLIAAIRAVLGGGK